MINMKVNGSKDYEYKVLSLIVNTGWFYWIEKKKSLDEALYFENKSNIRDYDGSKAVGDFNNHDLNLDDYSDLHTLLQKAIENIEAVRWFLDRTPLGKDKESGKNGSKPESRAVNGILSNSVLKYRIQEKKDLIIRPTLDEISQTGTCSIDLRLGTTFLVARLPKIARLDPTDKEFISLATEFQDKIYLPFGKNFTLHPGQFVLANTLEFVSVPDDLMGLVLDRASWGRLGLIMATSYKIIPGYKGCITLPLYNIGNAPITLYPCN